MEQFTAARTSQSTHTPDHRLLVINLDSDWSFSQLCRNLCLDLYQRRHEIEFWNVRDNANSMFEPTEAEFERVWKYWPKLIWGGVRAAIAEFEEKLSAELSGITYHPGRMTVLVIGSTKEMQPDATSTDGASRLERFQRALAPYFKDNEHHRSRIDLVLLLNPWERAPESSRLLSLIDRHAGVRLEAFDAVLLTDRHASGNRTPSRNRQEARFLLLRMAIEMFLADSFRATFQQNVRDTPSETSEAARRLLRIDPDTAQFELFRDVYVARVINTIEEVHALRRRQTGTRELGDQDDFIADVSQRLEDAKGITRRIDQAVSVNSISVPSLRQRFEALTRPSGSSGRHRGYWSREQSLEISLEEAFGALLTELQKAMTRDLASADGQVALSEIEAIRERQRLVQGLRSMTDASLGTGGRARTNCDEAKRKILLSLKDIEGKISAFWHNFGDQSPANEQAHEVPGADLVRRHCPLLQLEWQEVQNLLTAYQRAQSTIAALRLRPNPISLAVLSFSLFLLFPVLWGIGKLLNVGAVSEGYPVVGMALWLGLCLFSLVLPWRQVRHGHFRLSRALAGLDDYMAALTPKLNEGLASVRRYVGDIQQHHFIRRLDERIDHLMTESHFVDIYVDTLKRSFATPGTAATSDLKELVEELKDVTYDDWLDRVLTRLNARPGAGLSVYFRQSDEPIRVQSTMFKNEYIIHIDAME